MNIKLHSKIIVTGRTSGKVFDSEAGTAIGIALPKILVEFDKYIGGHDGMTSSSPEEWEGVKKGKEGYCWFILENDKNLTITILQDDIIINTIVNNIIKKLSK